MLTLFDKPKREDNPLAIRRRPNELSGEDSYPVETVSGTWWRVHPRTGGDVCFLQMLEHHRDKLAPAKGDGVLISTEVMIRHSHRRATQP